MIELNINGSPISVNHYTGFGQGRRFLTKKARDYQKTIKAVVESYKHLIIEGSVAVVIVFYFGDLRKRDVDNYSKVILDSLQGYIYKDDGQIRELYLIKTIRKKQPKVKILIYNLEGDDYPLHAFSESLL